MSDRETPDGQESGASVVNSMVESVTGTTFLTMMALFGARVAVVAGVSNPVGAIAVGTALIGAGVIAHRALSRERATISWANPKAVRYEEGGFKLGRTQLNASLDPPGATLVYDPPEGTKLDVGRHKIVARLADTETLYQAEPVEVTLTVNPAKVAIDWEPPAAKYQAGGFPFSTAMTATIVPDVADLQLDYKLTDGTLLTKDSKLDSGPHVVAVCLAATSVARNYTVDTVTKKIEVELLEILLEWTPRASIEYGTQFEALMTATTEGGEPGLVLAYQLANGTALSKETKLSADDHDLTVQLAVSPANKNYKAKVVPAKVKVLPAAATIAWTPPDGLEYGFQFGTVMTASVTPNDPELELEYKLADGTTLSKDTQLAVDDHAVSVSPRASPASKNYKFAPFAPVTIKVAKAKLKVKMTDPPEVYYVAGGFELTAGQFIAPSLPPGLELEYSPPLKQRLDVDDHPLRISLTTADVNKNYVFENVIPSTLRVKPATGTVTLVEPPEVFCIAGGFRLTLNQFIVTKDPANLDLDYTPLLNTILDEGEHDLSVALSTKPVNKNYRIDPVAPVKLKVVRQKVTIVWQDKAVDTTGGFFEVTDGVLDATTDPPDIDLVYSCEVGDRFEASRQNYVLEVSVDDPQTYDAESVEIQLRVSLSKEDSKAQASKRKVAKVASISSSGSKPFDPDDPGTWTAVSPAIYENERTRAFCASLTQPSDKALLIKFNNCTATDEHAARATGRRFHVHANDGSGGISFAYNHLGGKQVRCVVYDYCEKRDGNKYPWAIGGRTGGAALWYKPVKRV